MEDQMAANDRGLPGIVGFALLVILILAGCGTTESGAVGDKEPHVRITGEPQLPPSQGRLYNIAPAYMPPPGKCRIWYPGRPPEHQPPPGECADLERHILPNTWLLRGAKKE
jgi:hypothetical protein